MLDGFVDGYYYEFMLYITGGNSAYGDFLRSDGYTSTTVGKSSILS